MDDSPAATGGASGKGVYDPMSNENMTRNTAPTRMLKNEIQDLMNAG